MTQDPTWDSPTQHGDTEPQRPTASAPSTDPSTVTPPPSPATTQPPTAPAPVASGEVSLGNRLTAISGGLATVIFLLLGFVFHAWAWAWIVFLVPGLIHRWQNPKG